MGDFNELTGNHEKQGGTQRRPSSFLSFNQMIQNCGLIEFPKLGNSWSWRGVRNNGVVRCVLDKAFANDIWHDLFPVSEIEYLDMIGSDHRPIVGRFNNNREKRRHHFIFDKRWIGKTGFQETIKEGWHGISGQRRITFTGRIRNCRKVLSSWRSKYIPSGRVMINDCQRRVEDIQNSNSFSPAELANAKLELKKAYTDEELYWKQKSRNRWLREGDENTKFFHAQTKQRRAKNRIIGLFNQSGDWVNKETDMVAEATHYFSTLFSTNGLEWDQSLISDIRPAITADDNIMLLSKVTEVEVKKALFMMDPGKTPGPDGMTALFFQRSWEVVKVDLINLVNHFISTGSFEKGLNDTNICLIPKSSRPTKLAEFRPISLCNVGYKIISKIFCLRLRKLMPKLVSETQSAFVAGRLISDNILIAQEMFHALRTNNAVKGKYMAIKTDMSKAYDRVEWNLIENLLLKLGFSNRWITCIMHCITTVSYAILLNGEPKGKIIPTRGLRQGDPLSPYLFILCTEVLISKLRNAENLNLISGIPISRASPRISHLLFADDSLFFCKANTDEAEQIIKILKDYERISGQQINFEKSSIQFGKSIPHTNKVLIQNILGIHQLGGMGSYLGLPENITGAKIKLFAFVREKLEERISSWTSRFLSKGGKEVLIKSVLTALPTYVMSCYRLPKTIISKLNSVIAQFWWSNSETSKGVHWKKWKNLCKPKKEGGLGFRVLEEFNSALLAKQLWRLIDFPESLFAKVMKGKYYMNRCPITSNLMPNSSYGWRSIISARSLVDKGKIRKIGNGRSIEVWRDPWIPDIHPRAAIGIDPSIYPDLTVDQFIDSHSRSWRKVLLYQYFIPSDVQLIMGIPIPRRDRSDYWGWHYSKSGRYSVKSGYKLEESNSNLTSAYYGPNFGELYSKIWHLDCPNKIKHFIWQALTGCVAVKMNLNNRGIINDPRCSRCGAEEETINHALFECPPATQTWALSSIPSPVDVFPGNSIWYNLDYLLMQNQDSIIGKISPWIIWLLWKDRNENCFAGTSTDSRELVAQAEQELTEWTQAKCRTNQVSHYGLRCSDSIWSEVSLPLTVDPSFAGHRCFVDASWKSSDLVSGLGWICFSDAVHGDFRGTRQIRRSLSALHSEVEAVLWAMESLILHQILEVELATDCSDAQKLLLNPEDWPAFQPYQEDFNRLKSLFSVFSLHVIPRFLNHKADALARFSRESPIGIEV